MTGDGLRVATTAPPSNDATPKPNATKGKAVLLPSGLTAADDRHEAGQWAGTVLMGLGNPEAQYARTRHNVGCMVVDALAERWYLRWERGKGTGCLAFHRDEVHVLRPLTNMNLNGDSLGGYLRQLRKEVAPALIYSENILVVHDDLDQPYGRVRLRLAGSSGGHNGLKSIQKKLASTNYHRLKLGIGRPEARSDVAAHVLSPFTGTERAALPTFLQLACDAVECYLAHQGNVGEAMKLINTKGGPFQQQI
jgi:PTH1 family peptidyl-tRNA hydrolase